MFRTKFLALMVVVSTILTSQVFAQSALERIYGKGVHAYYNGQMNEARALFDEAITLGSEDPRVYYYRGVVSSQMGDTYGAKADFDRAAELEMNSPAGSYSIHRSLQRIQGSVRMEIEDSRSSASARTVVRRRPTQDQGSAIRTAPRETISPRRNIQVDPTPRVQQQPSVNFPDVSGVQDPTDWFDGQTEEIEVPEEILEPEVVDTTPAVTTEIVGNEGSGNRAEGSGLRDEGSGSRDSQATNADPFGNDGSGSRDNGSGSRDNGSGSRDEGSGSRDSSDPFGNDGSGSRDEGSDSRSEGSDSRDSQETNSDPFGNDGSGSRDEGSDSRSEGSDSRSEGSDSRASQDTNEDPFGDEGAVSKNEGSGSRGEGSDSRSEGSDSRSEGSDSRSEGSGSKDMDEDPFGEELPDGSGSKDMDEDPFGGESDEDPFGDG